MCFTELLKQKPLLQKLIDYLLKMKKDQVLSEIVILNKIIDNLRDLQTKSLIDPQMKPEYDELVEKETSQIVKQIQKLNQQIAFIESLNQKLHQSQAPDEEEFLIRLFLISKLAEPAALKVSSILDEYLKNIELMLNIVHACLDDKHAQIKFHILKNAKEFRTENCRFDFKFEELKSLFVECLKQFVELTSHPSFTTTDDFLFSAINSKNVKSLLESVLLFEKNFSIEKDKYCSFKGEFDLVYNTANQTIQQLNILPNSEWYKSDWYRFMTKKGNFDKIINNIRYFLNYTFFNYCDCLHQMSIYKSDVLTPEIIQEIDEYLQYFNNALVEKKCCQPWIQIPHSQEVCQMSGSARRLPVLDY